jgi:hypothetical protein
LLFVEVGAAADDVTSVVPPLPAPETELDVVAVDAALPTPELELETVAIVVVVSTFDSEVVVNVPGG